MLCFEAVLTLEAVSPDVFMIEDTYLVHLTTTVDTLNHSVCQLGGRCGGRFGGEGKANIIKFIVSQAIFLAQTMRVCSI